MNEQSKTNMDGLLFDPTEYTDPGIVAIMEGFTCRQCDHRIHYRYGSKIFSYCVARYLKVKACQPACLLFTHQNNAK